MKLIAVIFTFCFLFFAFHLSATDTWVKTYQPFGDGDYYVEDVIVCDDGGFAVNGFYYYFDDWNEMQWGYLMKTDSLGNFLWAKKDTVSWIEESESSAFVQTDDGGFLSAVYSLWGGTALIKRDEEGNREWVVDGHDLYVHSMDLTLDGNIILAGRMNGLPAMRKITQNTDIIWTKTYSINGDTSATLRSVFTLSDSGYAATGNIHFDETGSDILVIKVSEDGDTLWTKTENIYGQEYGYCIAENSNLSLLVGGWTGFPSTGFLWLIANGGGTEWTEFIDEDIGNTPSSIINSPDNNFVTLCSKLYKFDYFYNIIWISNLSGGGGDKCLKSINNGSFIFTGVTEENWEEYISLTKTDSCGQVYSIDDPGNPNNTISINIFPNPIIDNCTISFNNNITLKNPHITVYNIKGQKIRELEVENNVLGINEVMWDGKDYYGREAASGIYFCFIRAGENEVVRKMVKLTSP